jgi:PhnB protein
MSVNPYLNFAGNCREAVQFYAKVFHTEQPKFMTFGEMPGDPNFPMTDEAKNRILHADLVISGTHVMFSDTPPGMPVVPGSNISLTMVSTSRDEITNAWNGLKEGAKVTMDLQQTFWSKMYGMLTDKYGVGWMFSLDSGETFG